MSIENFEADLMARVGLTDSSSNNDFDWNVTQYCRELNDTLNNSKEELRYKLHLLNTAVGAFRVESSKDQLSQMIGHEISRLRNEFNEKDVIEAAKIQDLYAKILGSASTTTAVLPSTMSLPFHEKTKERDPEAKNCLACSIHQKNEVKEGCPAPMLHMHENSPPCYAGPNAPVFEFLGEYGGWIFRTENDFRPPPDYLPPSEISRRCINDGTLPALPHIVTGKMPESFSETQKSGTRLRRVLSEAKTASSNTQAFFDRKIFKSSTPPLPPINKTPRNETLEDSARWAKREVKKLLSLESWSKKAEAFLDGIDLQKQAIIRMRQASNVDSKQHANVPLK
eukprot:GDKK01003595.1.p1 GENE.GDKK01003595.1~~GDKK01003595.1.p1  ORF type:complete len:339 (+),score=36.08 GDKK01003595.1:62-1078(+)